MYYFELELAPLLVLFASGFSFTATAAPGAESAGAQSKGTKAEFAFSVPNDRTSRHFVSIPNAVTASSLVLESHHDFPAQPSQFAITPTAISPTVPSPAGHLDRLTTAVQANPMLAALLITSLLGLNNVPRPVAFNSVQHEPPNPYVALLLSQYGRYVPRPGIAAHGIYGYNAANNIHNTKPFGSYKIYEDSS